MSQTQLAFDLNRLQILLGEVLGATQARHVELSAILLSLALGGYIFGHFWKPKGYPNIAGPPRKSVILGHLMDLNSPYNLALHDALQDTYGSVSKVYGALGKEDLYVSDPRFLHEVLVKEADTVFRHPQYILDINDSGFGPGLLATSGDLHKAQRKMLNPVFTTKHMKSCKLSLQMNFRDNSTHTNCVSGIVETFNAIAENMRIAIIKDLDNAGSKEIDMLHWCSSTALELVGQAGLGHRFGMLEGIESKYSYAVRNYFPAIAELPPFMPLIFPMVKRLAPAWLRRKLARWVPSAHIRKLKEIVDIQDKQARDILTQKEAIKDETIAKDMHDIMSVLLKSNMQAEEGYRLPDEHILGQMNTLIFAGHETTSGALARILQLLASNVSVQDRLRAELTQAPNTLSYDELNALPYMDALCRETLRLFPPVPVLIRLAMKDWVVPLRYPLKGKDGSTIKEVHVAKGTTIYVGLRQANRCKETWGGDSDEFRPERWLGTLSSSVTGAKTPGVYSSMMTFSGGPRACIGFKFSLLELKVLLSMLIKSFKFSPGTTPVSWLACLTMVPYPAGTKDYIAEGKQPYMPLKVSVL